MKYKVGDKVRVRGDLYDGGIYGCCDLNEEMESYRGKIVTISLVGRDCYEIEEDDASYSWTDEMFEPVEEMSAAEAIKLFAELCNKQEKCDGVCPIKKIDAAIECYEIRTEHPEAIVEVLKQWKADREKKPIETEFAKIIRVIEDTGSGKVCVHEEEIDVIPGKLNEKMEEVLKNWCKDHDGKFFTVLERICRVKE